MAPRSWSHEGYILYSCFDLPVHSVFTYDEFCGRMSTSIFKNSSSAENNTQSVLRSRLSFRFL